MREEEQERKEKEEETEQAQEGKGEEWGGVGRGGEGIPLTYREAS